MTLVGFWSSGAAVAGRDSAVACNSIFIVSSACRGGVAVFSDCADAVVSVVMVQGENKKWIT